MVISLETWNTQDIIHILNDVQKNGGVAPGSGKAQCSSIGDYQDREVERGGWGNTGKEEGLWDLRVVGTQKRGNHLKCK